MLAAMLAQRQWLFATMVAPGIIACAASMLSTWASVGDDAKDAAAHRIGDDTRRPTHGTVIDGTNAGVPADAGGEVGAVMHALGTASLERLLQWGHLPWRDVVRAWLNPPTMRVCVGVGAYGVFRIDLRGQGPHALVAGTTGSGKSVLLQSWCLALAAANDPRRLNFVLLDFKGGSAFRPLEGLPHTVGVVCDLDLKHAVRALEALEAELRRRERLAADHHVADLDAMAEPPARLVIVVDEFHALKDQLPDYVGRLVRVASLGRSLGMHLIACTQNPLGQISADMKANISLNLCLRVRDDMQSHELLADSRAARIPPSLPGAAFCNDADTVTALRCAAPASIDRCCEAIRLAAMMMQIPPPPPLFTAPLPARLRASQIAATFRDADEGIVEVPFGLSDDGVRLHTARLRVDHGNIGVIGPDGRGKSALLRLLEHKLVETRHCAVRVTSLSRFGYRTTTPGPHGKDIPPPPPAPHSVWLVDDADQLFDPFSTDPQREAFHTALADPDVTVVFAVRSARHVRVPEHCGTRIVFPCGERTADLVSGIPSKLLASFDADDIATPGRAALISGGSAAIVQCAFADR
ncbi:FtsK/SpoIIIE domain-containing protein [Bifidobacterium eulemuris]|nr:FtsK/SpoIIIE domain-containing protein [Bifidobacterium eulemuris]